MILIFHIAFFLFLIIDKEFPSSFESIVKKILRFLFHVLAHIYHSHFKEIVLLNLHSHLNCIFAHLVLFNDKFKIVEEKEVEVLHDLAVALKLFPIPKSDILVDGDNFTSAIIDNNNGGVITEQCRSISPLVEANTKCGNLIEQTRRDLISGKTSTPMTVYQVPMNINEKWMIDTKNFDKKSSQSNCDKNNRRSISASAILLSSSDPSIPTTLSRRCNSDRTSGRHVTMAMYHHHATRGSICGMNTTPLYAACGSSPFKL